ncbi:MAG: TIGR01212 family radical SAM protein, partial [Treponema sp.]|nr:TIGR01212 family radical SAM protein [Candidatus Treponema equi]
MSKLTLNRYLHNTFSCKVYKISLSTGSTCPNRDGKISTGGCTFCSAGGSGEFGQTEGSIEKQIENAVEKISSKLPKTKAVKFIAYFQSFTNTYETKENTFQKLTEIFQKAHSDKRISALSIGTRPDCLSDRMIDFLSELNRTKPVWVELGLQTIHETTAQRI